MRERKPSSGEERKRRPASLMRGIEAKRCQIRSGELYWDERGKAMARPKARMSEANSVGPDQAAAQFGLDGMRGRQRQREFPLEFGWAGMGERARACVRVCACSRQIDKEKCDAL